jgi:hypothetical protein
MSVVVVAVVEVSELGGKLRLVYNLLVVCCGMRSAWVSVFERSTNDMIWWIGEP